MAFWVVIALMSCLAAVAVLWPLIRARRGAAAPAEAVFDAAVYRDQISEIDRDRERGLIGEKEASAARVEIARRLLKADEEAGQPPRQAASLWGRRITGILAIAIPLIAIAIYWRFGSPDLPDVPIEARLAHAQASGDMPAMVRKVELFLEKNPDDPKGWQLLAPIYMRSGEADKAANALRNLVRIKGKSADLLADLAEASLQAASNGDYSQAQAAVDEALKLDPQHPKAHFFHAYILSKTGNTDAALTELRALRDAAPADAPWRGDVEMAISHLSNTTPPAAGPGPSAADVRAAAGMSAGDRNAMIAGMVQRLADRLATNPNDKDGWLKLIRAYQVMGRKDDALAAVGKAKAALAADSAALAEIDQAAKELH